MNQVINYIGRSNRNRRNAARQQKFASVKTRGMLRKRLIECVDAPHPKTFHRMLRVGFWFATLSIELSLTWLHELSYLFAVAR